MRGDKQPVLLGGSMVASRSARQNAHRTAQDILFDPLVIFDTETNGLGANAEIVEIACIDGGGAVLLASLVRPAHPIPRDATNIHGITDADVQGAPTIVDLMPGLQEIWQQASRGNRVFAYNLDYDARLLVQSFGARRQRWPFPHRSENDIMQLYAEYYGDWSDWHGSFTWQSLSRAVEQCDLAFDGEAHRALADARASLAVLRHMAAHP